MRLIFTLLTLGSLGFGGWYAWDTYPPLRAFAREKLHRADFCSLEIRYSAEELMRHHGSSYLEPKLLYYPYLLMDVKYSKGPSTTEEGILLWSLTDGEMVLNTTTWEKTHGFEDCLLTKVNRNEFMLLQTLIENGGSVKEEKLYKHSQATIKQCLEKKLIVASGNKFRLHFQNPRLKIQPSAHLGHTLISLSTKYSGKVKKKYSSNQIKKLTEIAFGNDLAIRKSQKIFLPVYSISLQNSDGSTHTVYYNALTGKKINRATRPEAL